MNSLERTWQGHSHTSPAHYWPCRICGEPGAFPAAKECTNCYEVMGRLAAFLQCQNGRDFVQERMKDVCEKVDIRWGINTDDLIESDKGRWVEYAENPGVERGRIKRWTENYIFVVYHCDDQWDKYDQYTAAATNPNALRFIESEEK